MHWDAIIVGAGPAGCAAAYDLAAAGRSVLLVDKSRFPRPKACAGALTVRAVRALRYPVTPVVRKVVSDAMLKPPGAAHRPLAVTRRRPFCMMTVRSELDAFCLEQARTRGAVFRQIGAISGLQQEAGRVLLHTAGAPEPLAAHYLLGADGVHSRVRSLAAESRVVGSAWFRTGFAVEANVPYSATYRGAPLLFDFAAVHGGYGWVFPRNDHANVGLYTSEAQGAGPDRGVDRAALTRYIAEQCGEGRHEHVVGQFLGLGGAGYRPASTRVLLAGDAAGMVDPLTGEGISAAILSGQAAAAAIHAALAGKAEAAAAYDGRLERSRADLAVSEGAARAFYARPQRALELMRMPWVRGAVVHAYSDGASLKALARGLRLAKGLL